MRGMHVRGALLLVMLVVAAVALPGAGQTKPPQDDGSVYTWAGASILTVDVKPWGAGYVRSDPYLVDCPLACIRPVERGRELTLVAHVTPGHKFESWEGACAGQANPCRLTASSAAVDVTAVYSGQYVPPAPPALPAVTAPSLTVDTSGLSATLTGTGYTPNSAVSLDFQWSTPPGGWSLPIPDATTSDASGSWSYVYTENCDFGGPYSGPAAFTVSGIDAVGVSASGGGSMIC